MTNPVMTYTGRTSCDINKLKIDAVRGEQRRHCSELYRLDICAKQMDEVKYRVTVDYTFPLPDPGGRKAPEEPHGCPFCWGGGVWLCTKQWKPLKGLLHSGNTRQKKKKKKRGWDQQVMTVF